MISTIALLALLLRCASPGIAENCALTWKLLREECWGFLFRMPIAVVGSLMLRVIPSTDLRSATSVFALGPLSAIRSLAMIVVVVYGVAPSSEEPT